MVKAQSDGEFSDTMDLSEMTWLVRDFGEAVSSCKITDSSFIIGGWNGKLAQYSTMVICFGKQSGKIE